MPNGGVHHCYHCCNHDPDNDFCNLRNVTIEQSHWTSCRNRDKAEGEIDGPLFAIVCEVKSGAGRYNDIPYLDGCRVDTVQEDAGDTIVRVTDLTGKLYEFDTVEEYLDFYQNSGRPL